MQHICSPHELETRQKKWCNSFLRICHKDYLRWICPWNMTCYTWQELWVCDLDTAYVWVFGLKTSLASRHGNRVRKSAFHCWIWAQSKLPNQGERASALHLLCACDELDHEIMNCEAWKNSCLIIREFLSWLWAINFTWAKWFISLVGNHHAANLYWIWALEHRLRLLKKDILEFKIRTIWAE